MATSNADFYRAQFAAQNQRDQNRQNALTDQYRESEIGRLNDMIGAIQAHPTMTPDEKAQRIGAARQQILQLYTPSMGKKRVAQLQQQFNLTPQQNTPAEAAMTVGGQPIQQQAENPNPGMDIPSGSELPKINFPARAAVPVAKAPDATSSLLAGTPPPNPLAMYRAQLQGLNMSPEDVEKAVRVKTGLEAPAKMFAPHSGQWETIYGTKDGEPFAYKFSKALGQAVDLDGQLLDAGDLEGFVPAPKGAAAKGPKLGSLEDFIGRVAQNSGVTPADIDPTTLLKLKQAYVSAGQTGHVNQGHYIYKDERDGTIHDIPIVRRTSPVPVAIPPIPNAHAPVNPPVMSDDPRTGGIANPPGISPEVPKTPAQARARVPKVAAPAVPAQPAASGGKVIGQTASLPEKTAIKAATVALPDMRQMVNIDQTMGEYMNQIQKNPAAATPRQDLSLVIAAVRAMNPRAARLPILELQKEISAGSWGDRFRRQFENASTGLLPADQRADLYNVVHHETAVSVRNAAGELTAAHGILPPWMAPYQQANVNPGEKVMVIVDGDKAHPYAMTREAIQRAEADGHQIVRQ